MTTFGPEGLFIGGILASLLLGTIVRLIAVQGAEPARRRQRLDSLRSWWLIGLLLCLAIAFGRPGLTLLLALASGLALREYLALTGLGRESPVSGRLLIGLAMAHYAIVLGGGDIDILWPLTGIMLIVLVELRTTSTLHGHLRRVAGLSWGGLILVYGLSYTLQPFDRPVFASGPAGPLGWVLYLIVLTEVNDIAQALTGRALGAHKRHRITPRISPHKTWEGLLGGLLVTGLLAVLLAPAMTDLVDVGGRGLALLAGLVIAVSGLLGDLNMSAIKRDAGVKDSGHLLPGIGGIIDRIDSLSWSAPAFVAFVSWTHASLARGLTP